MRPKILEKLHAGEKMTFITDAGMPLISDPGYKLVKMCRENAVYLTVIPGASSVLAEAGKFEEFTSYNATLVFFESAPRLVKTLEKMSSAFLNRNVTVVREITKMFEEAQTGAFVLPEAARDIPDELKNMNTNEGWMRFKRLLLNPDLFKEGNALSSDRKASWLNDVELIGFQMGVLPNFRGDYIDTLWAKDNQWMEVQHNYVQWWFPNEVVGMGDGILTPRFLESTANILQKKPIFGDKVFVMKKHPLFLKVCQELR
eukprot:gene15686-15838_t